MWVGGAYEKRYDVKHERDASAALLCVDQRGIGYSQTSVDIGWIAYYKVTTPYTIPMYLKN